jgi:hypothetical protein
VSTPRLLAAAALALVLAVPTSGARADDPTTTATPPAGAPVTRADRVTVATDSFAEVDVLGNDTDPDEEDDNDLTVCRVEQDADVPVAVFPTEGFDSDGGYPVLMVAPRNARPGTYTIDYYVCDYDYLTPATLTVRVVGPQQPYAEVVASRPGRVRFHNPGTRRTVIQYGSRDGRTVDGRFVLAPGTARTVRTTRRAIQWTATVRTHDSEYTAGAVLTGIPQRAGAERQARSSQVARTTSDRTAWRLGTQQVALAARGASMPPGRAGAGREGTSDGSDSAPVTAPDTVSVSRGFLALADVLANDSDPDGPADDLAVCRVGRTGHRGIEAVPLSGDGGFVIAGRHLRRPAGRTDEQPLLVVADDRTPEGTYEVTYYACDRQYLTPGTVTVTVTKSQKVTARKVASRRGVVRFTNPGPHGATVRVDDLAGWMASDERPRPLLRFELPAGASKNVRPGVRRILWSASSRRGPGGGGVIRGLGRAPRG